MIFLLLLFLSLPVLAAGTEAQPFPLPAPLLPPELVSSLVTLLVSALLSGIAAAFNTWLRGKKRKGKKASPAVLAAGAALNAVAFNFDQTARQVKASNVAKAGEPKP